MTRDDDRDGFTKVADAQEIPEGRGIGVDGIGITVFTADDEYFALSNRCAYHSAPLCKVGERKVNAEHTWTETQGGVNAEANTVSCPWHLWTWDLETGKNEATGSRIPSFDCGVEDGHVLVQL